MQIIYADEALIVINKPSGLLTIRDGYNPDLPTVKSLLEQEFGRCWIVHRLDKETSGVLLVARNESVHRSLNLFFQNRQIKKTYHALVFGEPSQPQFSIDLPLRINGDRKHRTVVDETNGKPAKSEVSLIKSNNSISLVKIIPYTGYTHQIRVHLSAFGFPLIGDKLYGKLSNESLGLNISLLSRTALHAFEIEFRHPVENVDYIFKADYPPDFLSVLQLIN
jgi:tRNA pseudouridine32 synthase/23S rRNA pseudouridine746 synthase